MLWFTPGPRGSCLHGLAQPLWPQHPCSMEQVEQVDPAGFSLSSPLRQCSSLCTTGKMKLLTALQGPSWLDSCLSLSFPCTTPPAPDPSRGPCPCGLLSGTLLSLRAAQRSYLHVVSQLSAQASLLGSLPRTRRGLLGGLSLHHMPVSLQLLWLGVYFYL